MLKADLKRMREYVDRIGETPDLTLTVLTREEYLDLERLILMRMVEAEFGFPIRGED